MSSHSERSLPEVLQDIIGNVQDICRSEFQLAKTEIKEEVAEASKPAVTLGVGLLLSAYAIALLLLAAVFGLATIMALWSAALLVGAAVAIVAVLMINSGRAGLKRVNVKSERLIASLQENVRWAKRQTE